MVCAANCHTGSYSGLDRGARALSIFSRCLKDERQSSIKWPHQRLSNEVPMPSLKEFLNDHKGKAARVYVAMCTTQQADTQIYYEGQLDAVGDDYVLLDKTVAIPFASISHVKVT
jgi:hypothetical protein